MGTVIVLGLVVVGLNEREKVYIGFVTLEIFAYTLLRKRTRRSAGVRCMLSIFRHFRMYVCQRQGTSSTRPVTHPFQNKIWLCCGIRVPQRAANA